MDTLCMKCGKSFADKYGLQRHLNNKKKSHVLQQIYKVNQVMKISYELSNK